MLNELRRIKRLGQLWMAGRLTTSQLREAVLFHRNFAVRNTADGMVLSDFYWEH